MILYADGSANLADKTGGWAWWVSDELCDSGFVRPATNNTMEIMAVIQGLESLEWDGNSIEVVSDSSYVINCMNQGWYLNWRIRGWLAKSGEPVANQDLWRRLLDVVERWPNTITWTHVRGHGRGANDAPHHVKGNAIVDKMAGAARKSGGVGQETARQRALAGGKPRRKPTLAALEHVVFVVDGIDDRTFSATSIDGNVVTLGLNERE